MPAPIIPSYILEALAQQGDDRVKQAASRTLALDEAFRAARERSLVVPAQTVGTPGSPDRTIRDAGNAETTQGKVVRAEGENPTGDAAADEAYDGLGATYDLFWSVFERDSIDGRGLPLQGVVHYGQDYDNAFWDGTQMVFGDGDGVIFNRFTVAVDVIGHELAHGVTEVEAGLVYRDQSGALNESVSDCFGSMVKQHALGQTAEGADWLIGAGLLAEGVNGVALRSMRAPGTAYDDERLGGKDPQPAHFDDYVTTSEDDGGVHINSGIPNRAFYLAAVALGGNSWDQAGPIWYATLRDDALNSDSTFAAFAALTVAAAARLYDDAVSAAVRNAWEQVGVDAG